MTILIACDKFRGSLTARQANAAVLDGLSRSPLDVPARTCPVADGGEGTLEALEAAGGALRRTLVTGPFGTPVEAEWLLDPAAGRAVIEMARAAGHAAVEGHGYDPDTASSVGLGELIGEALDAGARHVIVAVGGSVTVDGGAGALEALGARYLDGDGAVLHRPAGRALSRIARVDLSGLDPRLQALSITMAADVDNPLVGQDGAAAVFGPQKGVAADAVAAFDDALAHFDQRVAVARGAQPLAHSRHAGAAGGVLVGLSAMASTVARDGFSVVAQVLGLDELVGAAALVVTGEGSLDGQSLAGKGPVALARMAREAGVPAIAFAGRLAVPAEDLRAAGIAAAFSIVRGPATLEEALAAGHEGLAETATNAFSLLASAPWLPRRGARSAGPD